MLISKYVYVSPNLFKLSIAGTTIRSRFVQETSLQSQTTHYRWSQALSLK